MKIPYRDLSVKNLKIKRELLQAVEKVLSHGRILLGPEVDLFEQKICNACKRKYAVGVNSGSDALYLALRCLGIGPGDEVITTPLSWIATVNAIVLTGATPVFVDIKKDLNIDHNLIEQAITPRTKAILPVHFTGKLCDMSAICDIAEKNQISLIEDAAQSFGAHINGRMAGSFGDVGCFSMNPMKVLCAYGEAGAIVTDDDNLHERLMSLRYAGTVNKEDCHFPSLNGRLDTIQAAMMLVNLKHLDQKIKRLRQIADAYTERLKDLVTCPEDDGTDHAYYSYTVITNQRDELKGYLATKGVETKIQHPILMPYHTAYQNKYTCDIPVAETLVKKILCLPNEESLSMNEIEYIVACVREFFGTS